MRVVLICISLRAWASIFLSAYVRFDQFFPLLYTKQAGLLFPFLLLCYAIAMKRCPRGLGLGGLRPLAPAPYVVLDPLFNILFTLPPPPLTYFPPVLSASVFSSIFFSSSGMS